MGDFEHISPVLCKIRKDYNLYLGKKSYERLIVFLKGYKISLQQHNTIQGNVNLFPGFDKFVREFFKVALKESWEEIIQKHCKTDEEAFDKFFELLDIFYGKWFFCCNFNTLLNDFD